MMPTTKPHSLKIFIIAGEASGDALGVRLMADMKEKTGGTVEFSGVGGGLMAQEGLHSLFPMTDLSVMGVAEVLPRLPLILRRIAQTVAAVERERPDIVITIDSPDFCFRVVRKLRQRGYTGAKFVHYVAPTVWAWRPERAKKISSLYDGLLCLFPFEPPYFEREGLESAFVGHPVLGYGFDHADVEGFRTAHGIAPEQKILGLLFGSRRGELKRMGAVLRQAALETAQAHPNIVILAPTLPHLEEGVRALLEGFPCPVRVMSDSAMKRDAFAAMDAALATSGTVGLELAVANVPHAIGYRMNALTWQVIRRKVRVKFAHLANILLDRPAVPEFIQADCTVAALKGAAERCLYDEAFRAEQSGAFEAVRELVRGKDDAAGFVVGMIG